MATPAFADLMTVPDQDTVLNQEVLPELVKRKVKVTDWATGAVTKAQAYVIALMRVSVRLAIATLCAAGFEDYVFGVATPPPNADGSIIDVTGWAPLVAKQRYGVDQLPATYTRRAIVLTNASASTYGPLQPGPSLMVQFPSGNRYVLDQVGTINPSGNTTLIFRSEFTSNSLIGRVYNDAPYSTIFMVTSNYAGVTASNPAPVFSPIAQIGSGQGSFTISGVPLSPPHNVVVRIDSTGSINGVAPAVAWSTNVDNLGWVSQPSSGLATNIAGTAINISLIDNGVTYAFVAGASYYFTTPGTDIIQVGADIETPQALGLRCRGLWPSLAFQKDVNGNWVPASPTTAAYVTLALSANSQVRIVLTSPDPLINNKVNVVIAGQGGVPLSSAVVANVQNFFNFFKMITDLPFVTTTTSRIITLGGLAVTIKQSLFASATAEMNRRILAYLGSVDVASPLGINGLVDWAYINALVRTTPGVTHVSGTLTINGASTDLQLPVTPTAFESALWSQSVSTAFALSTV